MFQRASLISFVIILLLCFSLLLTGLIFLKPRIAPWRYDRGSRSLVANLKAAGDSFPSQNSSTVQKEKLELQSSVEQEDEEEVEVPEEVEEVVEELIQGLRDTENVIRYHKSIHFNCYIVILNCKYIIFIHHIHMICVSVVI